MPTARAENRGTQAPVCFTVAIFHVFERLQVLFPWFGHMYTAKKTKAV